MKGAHSRGLTLIEVLAATVLLAGLAAACVPVLRGSFSILHDRSDEELQIAELSALIDQLKLEPEAFGLNVEEIARPDATFEVHWPQNPERAALHASIEASDHPDATHAWLVLTAADTGGNTWSVARLIELAEEQSQ